MQKKRLTKKIGVDIIPGGGSGGGQKWPKMVKNGQKWGFWAVGGVFGLLDGVFGCWMVKNGDVGLLDVMKCGE